MNNNIIASIMCEKTLRDGRIIRMIPTPKEVIDRQSRHTSYVLAETAVDLRDIVKFCSPCENSLEEGTRCVHFTKEEQAERVAISSCALACVHGTPGEMRGFLPWTESDKFLEKH
jgi:hypothetical protein